MSVEKHSSLKPHFTLTILPPSPLLHFAAFCSPLLHMVKVEHCTCPVKHCFLKFKITDEFFVLLKSTGSLKSTKRAITKMHWLCGQVSGNIFFFFLKTINFFSWANIFRLPNIASRWYLKITDCYSYQIQLLPPTRHVNGISRCVYTLARLDVYVSPIKVIISVVKGWVMLVIAQ